MSRRSSSPLTVAAAPAAAASTATPAATSPATMRPSAGRSSPSRTAARAASKRRWSVASSAAMRAAVHTIFGAVARHSERLRGGQRGLAGGVIAALERDLGAQQREVRSCAIPETSDARVSSTRAAASSSRPSVIIDSAALPARKAHQWRSSPKWRVAASPSSATAAASS